VLLLRIHEFICCLMIKIILLFTLLIFFNDYWSTAGLSIFWLLTKQYLFFSIISQGILAAQQHLFLLILNFILIKISAHKNGGYSRRWLWEGKENLQTTMPSMPCKFFLLKASIQKLNTFIIRLLIRRPPKLGPR
jgi:hypothetical protein